MKPGTVVVLGLMG